MLELNVRAAHLTMYAQTHWANTLLQINLTIGKAVFTFSMLKYLSLKKKIACFKYISNFKTHTHIIRTNSLLLPEFCCAYTNTQVKDSVHNRGESRKGIFSQVPS